jgi:hypothetical protein
MKVLTIEETDSYLAQVRMKRDDWNRIAEISDRQSGERRVVKFRAPENSKDLLKFATYVASWVPRGNWKLLNIDNSTSLSPVETHFLAQLLFGSGKGERIGKGSAFLFEFEGSKDADEDKDLLIADLIFLLLLFEAHAAVTSSASSAGQLLSIEDGFVYFLSPESSSDAENLLREYERTPRTSPQWILEIIAKRQDP